MVLNGNQTSANNLSPIKIQKLLDIYLSWFFYLPSSRFISVSGRYPLPNREPT